MTTAGDSGGGPPKGGDVANLVARARELYEAGLFDDALHAASEALSREPGNADAAAVKVVAQARLGAAGGPGARHPQALEHVGRARAYVNAGDWTRASNEAQAILDFDPENEDAYRLLQEIRAGAERAAVLERERLRAAAAKRVEPPAPEVNAVPSSPPPDAGAPPAPIAAPAPPPRGPEARIGEGGRAASVPAAALPQARPRPPVAARKPLPRPPAPPAAARRLPPPRVVYGGAALLVIAVAAGIYFLYPSAPLQPPAPAVVEEAADAGGLPPDASSGAAAAPAPAPAAEPSPAVQAPPGPAPAVAPARGPRPGVPPRRRADTASAEKSRAARDLQQRYTRAKAAAGSGDYQSAIAGFQGVLELDSNYLDAAQQLEAARAGARQAAERWVASGNQAEAAGNHAAALDHYASALRLDPSSPAADATGRVRARMLVEGEDSFKRGRQYDALGRVEDAVGMYEKALKLLPPDHPSAKTARERLAAIRGGD